MRESLRGRLLSVLFVGGLALFALPATAQSDSGQSPDGSTTCGGGNCASDGGTVDAGNNSSGTPGAGNPLGGNPLGGDPTGGMGDPAPVWVPSGGSRAPSTATGDMDMTTQQAMELLRGFCDTLRDGKDPATLVGALLAIAKKNPYLFVVIFAVINGGIAGCNMAGL